MTTGDDNFFSRWSRRKVQVRSGDPLPPEPAPSRPPAAATPVAVAAPPVVDTPVPAGQPEESPPVPTLDDVARLTPESDFSTFVARGVPANVRNAAVKKLFADPHFNVMDGLDIYIDDYSLPSPMSVAEMGKMVGAQFLKLVEDPNEKQGSGVAAPSALRAEPAPTQPETTADAPPHSTDNAPAEAPPLMASASEPTEPHDSQDDHPDLQLQPDHAPGPQGPGRGAG